MLLTDDEIKTLNNIFYNNDLYLSGLNKFNIAVNKSGHYIPQNKIRYYYKNQEITQLFKPRIKLYNKISETNKPFNQLNNTVCCKSSDTFFFSFFFCICKHSKTIRQNYLKWLAMTTYMV